MLSLAQIEAADSTDEQVGYDKIEESHSTLTDEEDEPTPGGDAKGLWNACPEIPLPRWVKVLARTAPRKKCAK